MANAVLDRLLAQRQEQFDFISQLLERVEADARDMVDAERANLQTARTRVEQLDAQIGPLEEFEQLRSTHEASLARLPAPREREREPEGRPLDRSAAVVYRSAGGFMVDLLRARGYMRDRDNPRQMLPPDPMAQARITRALENQTTLDTPGLLPTPIVGQVVNLIDASRPLVTSVGGAKAMGGIPGKNFERPKITQHTVSGKQAAEKTQLPSRKMTIDPITFAKETHGGSVDVSRQDIDWTSPAAWDILIRDLADSYAIDTETAAALAFAASVVTNSTPLATNDLPGWVAALYAAAGQCYTGGKRLPDRIWCSVDVWGQMGALVDQARLALPPAVPNTEVAGTSDLTQFGGYVLSLPRIVVPSFPDGTCILGPSTLFEVYEEVIGLLSVIEPSILGVEVAYGGYVAYGTLEERAFAKIVVPVIP